MPLEKRITSSSVSPTYFVLHAVLSPKPDPLAGTTTEYRQLQFLCEDIGADYQEVCFQDFVSRTSKSYLTSKLRLILLNGRAGPNGSEYYSDKCLRTSTLTSRMR